MKLAALCTMSSRCRSPAIDESGVPQSRDAAMAVHGLFMFFTGREEFVLLVPATLIDAEMVSYYDELEIEDFTWDEDAKVFHYPCPCGDRFEISKGQLRDGEEIATCPSCSLIVRVIYDYVSPAILCPCSLADKS